MPVVFVHQQWMPLNQSLVMDKGLPGLSLLSDITARRNNTAINSHHFIPWLVTKHFQGLMCFCDMG